MKFLCLPGAYGSAENFKVQLAPWCDSLTAAHPNTTFYFTQGKNPCVPPPGFEDYFGPRPHFRFIEYDGIQQNDVLERVRDFPEGENPEDVLRELVPDGKEDITKSINDALADVYQTIEEHGPFDGIAAYSEGTVVAGILILDEARRLMEEGRPRSIKYAVFFNGWPPLKPGSMDILLADTCEEVIDIPTCHVVGADDPYLAGAMALFNICDQDTAVLFDHGKGHTIPREKTTLAELTQVIRGIAGEA